MLSADDMVRSLIYGTPTTSTINYFQNQLDKVTNAASNFGSWIKTKATDIYNNYYSDRAIAESRKLLQETAVQFRDDVFHYIDIDTYKPNLLMQQYIIAEPSVYKLYKKDMLSNFNGTFVDYNKNISIPEFRSDYLRAVNGVLDNGCIERSISSHDKLDTLSIIEQNIVKSNWNVAIKLLENGYDPTELK